MKKIFLLLLCLATLVMAGCGDKFAKEKEAVTKAEQAAMSMQLPDLVRPDFLKEPRPGKEEMVKFRRDFRKLAAAEKKILEKMRESDKKLAAMEAKASGDSEKKDVKAFTDKIRKARADFVRKISRERLYGDTFGAGVGSTWQEVEMAYGKPVKIVNRPGVKEYRYAGIRFRDWAGGGVPSPEQLKKWKSVSVQAVTLNKDSVISDAGVKTGMSPEEVKSALQAKYVKKYRFQKDPMEWTDIGNGGKYTNMVTNYSMKDTIAYQIFLTFKDGKLTRYTVAPH